MAALLGALAGALGVVSAFTAWPLALAALSMVSVCPGGRMRLALLVLAIIAGTAGHAALGRAEALSPSLATWFATAGPDSAGPVTVAARIVEDASLSRGGGVRLLLDVTRVRVATGPWRAVSGRVLVHVGGEAAPTRVSEWSRGRHLTAPVALRWPAFTRNPGSASIAWQALTRGHVLTGSIKSAMQVHAVPATWPHEAARALREYVRRTAGHLLGEQSVAAAVVIAILIGDRAGLDPSVEQRLMEAGTYHVLAISGGNIAVLTAVVVAVVGALCRSFRVSSVVAGAIVATYGWVVAGDPSVTRAVTAALIWLAARAAGQDARPIVIFCSVTLGVLMLQPLLVVDVGAWLSFGAVFGILIFATPCARALARRLPAGAGWQVLSALSGVFIVSVCVQIVLLPVGAVVFAQVPLAGPLANLLAVPAMAVVQVAGAAAIGLASLSPIAAGLAGDVAAWAVWAIVEPPRLLEWGPLLAWQVPPPPALWLGAYYAAAASALAPWASARTRIVAAAALAAAIVALPWTASMPGRSAGRGWLRVTVFDVGQGDSTLVELPGGQRLLVDGGNRSETFDTGLRVVAPAMYARGVRALDWIALSHGDRDHAGGLPSLVRLFRPHEVWEGIPVARSGERQRVIAAAEDADAVWREIRRGDRIHFGGAVVEVLHPDPPDWERQRVRNDDALVLRLRYGVLDMLLTGDVSAAVEATLIERLADPAARGAVRILKVGHHGSQTSTSAALLEAYTPWVGIVSAGRNNAFGHPSPATLDRLRRTGVDVFRTDRDGATTVESDGRVVQVTTWTGQSRRLVVRPPAHAP